MADRRARLGEATWTELTEQEPPLLVVPVGSCEQHGPHLPLATDTMVAEWLAAELVASRGDAVLAPAIAVGASGEHQGFPGTLSIGTDVMTSVVVELCRSADWARGTLLVNGHGGNRRAVDRAVALLVTEGRHVAAWWPHIDGADLHAGHVETSLVLAMRADLVRRERAVAGPVPSLDELVRHGVRAVSPTGVLGDPSGASAGQGRDLLARLSADLRRFTDDHVGADRGATGEDGSRAG